MSKNGNMVFSGGQMETKTCNVCGVEKPLDSEYFRLSVYKRKDGQRCFRPTCRSCDNKKNLDRYHNKGGKQKQKTRAQRYNLKKYGLSVEEYNEMVLAQDGKCKICLSTDSHRTNTKYNLFVDHCHKTGKIRGLLCHHCNAALGHMRDSKDVLERAIRYLDENSS
jgi:hypothetical protein